MGFIAELKRRNAPQPINLVGILLAGPTIISEAAVSSAERALQVHGGMGMTWEAPPHLYLRRALASSSLLGGPHWHRRQIGVALLKQQQNKNSC